MKKILLFTDSLGAGGAQMQLVGLATFLFQKGYEVKVCTYHNIDFFKGFLDGNNVPNELIPKGNNSKKRMGAVGKYFKREAPDWVIAYQETPSIVACVAKVFGGKFRLIVSERNTTQHIGWKDRLRFFLYHWADAIVPNSHSQGEFLATHYRWMKDKLTIISNFVDLKHFNFVERRKRVAPEIAVAATIWKPKNTLGLIEAVEMLTAKGYKFHVSWYGKSNSNIEYFLLCQQKIEELGVEDYISLKDKTKQIKDVYQDCDFFCLPSFYEGTPNVICEAMSSGRPVICSAVCDNPVYVAEGRNGFLFDPRNSRSIADAIERALNVSDKDYSCLCEQSRTIAENLLSVKLFVNKYTKIIESK